MNPSDRFLAPNSINWFGTDNYGRDICEDYGWLAADSFNRRRDSVNRWSWRLWVVWLVITADALITLFQI